MKSKRHFLNRRPRPKGWKRTHMHVSTKQRAERDFRPVPLDGQGYLLAPCVVLAAAIIGTRQAYWAAMAVMEVARDVDSRRFA